MPQLTDPARKQLISQKVADLAFKHETVRIPTSTNIDGELCSVITISVDDVYLNPFSHRIKSQLEDDPMWSEVKGEPFSSQAQIIVAKYVKNARKSEDFETLKSSLNDEGQTEPGVITNEGVLVNGNTRAVAIRELHGAQKKVIRVAVLMSDVSEKDIVLMEGRLQVRKDHKIEYSFTNQLRFVEDLEEKNLSKTDIAMELRLDSTDPKKAVAKVEEKLEMLELLRQMARIPKPAIGLSRFDQEDSKVTEESLSVALAKYKQLNNHGKSDAAERFLENWVFCVFSGNFTVHKLRLIDEKFVEYGMQALNRDEDFKLHFEDLPSRESANVDEDPSRMKVLGLIDALTVRSAKVPLGEKFAMNKDKFRQAVSRSVEVALQDKKQDAKRDDAQRKPLDLLQTAMDSLEKCEKMFREEKVSLDEGQKKKFNYLVKRLQKDLKNLNETLEKKYSAGDR